MKHLLLVLLFILPLTASAKFKVAVFTPRDRGDMFWGLTVDFMKEAAKDLGVEVKDYYAKGSFFLMYEDLDRATKSGVDAVMLSSTLGNIDRLIRLCNDRKVPVLVFNAKAIGSGEPREQYPYWIGAIYPDDERGGARLLSHLNKRWQAIGNKGKADVLAFEGLVRSSASILRRSGLIDEVSNHKNLNLVQLTNGDWDRKLTSDKFTTLKQSRHKSANIIWTASDGMALGVLDAAKKLGLTPEKDFVTGGFDMSREGLEAIRKGQLTASLGGHFAQGAWGLVLLHDYLHGKDFKDSGLVYKTSLSIVTKKNVDMFEKLLKRENWAKIDFNKFTKAHNRSLKNYSFSITQILRQL